MKMLLTHFFNFDVLLFSAIFQIKSKSILPMILPKISKSANGPYYFFVPLIILALNWHTGIQFFLAGTLAYAFELTLYKATKQLLKRNRPFEVLKKIHKRIEVPDQFSFPSGHTGGAFVMAYLISHFFPSLSLPMYLWASLVGISRIYLGMHYPSDILAGGILGITTAFLGLKTIL